MRLHRLEVTAFGPFAGTEQVDFDELAAGGLFLFTGPTGAGKTSILDAVCFALYGQVPGPRGNRALRSDHAADGAAPQVVLELTLRGRRLRVTRSPQWERPKRRGSGTVTEQARVLVEECTGDGYRALATRLDEAGHLLGPLLGLSLAQFCQVVLLPQGQFAEFLRADAEKRRGLLESLFDTGRFTAVERWLVARRQEAARSLDEADQRLRQVLARIAEAAAVEVPDDVLDPVLRAAGAAEPWLAQLLTVARDERASAQDLAAGAADRHAAAAATLETAALRAEAHTRRAALRARLARLEAEAPRQAAAAAEVEAARTVAPLLPLVTEVARLQAELEQARVTARSTQVGLTDQLRATGTDQARLVGSTLPAPRTLETVARGHRDEAAGLATLTKDEAEADRLAQATDAMLRSVVELDEQSHQLAEQLAASGERRGLLEAARERSQAAVAGLPGSRAALDAARVRLAAGQRRDELARDLVTAADLVRSCTDLSQAARERWLGLRQARLDGMAAELAAGLSPGADCPVCGSAEHPRPAAAVPGAVDRQQEDAAAAVLAAAEERRVAAAAAHAACDLELSAARAGAGGDVPLPDLVAAHDTAAAELDALQARAAAATADAEAVLAFGQQHEGWLRQRVALAAKADALRARVEDDRTRLSQLRSGLDGARGDDPSVAARAARLGRLAAALEALARQVGAVEQLDDQVAAALERAERAAHGRGLDTLDLVLLAARDDAVVQQLDEAASPLRRRGRLAA